jgi:peptidoglycan/LPS O-acetylase OafA/YrhL
MRIVVLDSLRGLFAVAIVFLHGPFQGNLHYNAFVRNSDVFVDFFFVLSGFVIALAYSERVRDGRSLAGFLIRRTGRLWPLHLFMLMLFLLVLAAKLIAEHLGLFSADVAYSVPEVRRYALENVFLVQAFRNDTVFWLNFPSWSISVEFWAYVAFGLLCLTPRLLPFAAVAIILVATLVMLRVIDPGFGHFFGDGLYRGASYFFLGYLTYQLWRRVRHNPLPVPHFLEIALIGLIIWQVAFLSDSPVTFYLLPLTFALAILVFSYEAGVVSRLLKTRPLLTLGTLSFSIYMIHIFVYSMLGIPVRMAERLLHLDLHSPDLENPAANDLMDFGSPLLNDLIMIAMVCVVLACAALTYRLIELPGQRLARDLARDVESRPAAQR